MTIAAGLHHDAGSRCMKKIICHQPCRGTVKSKRRFAHPEMTDWNQLRYTVFVGQADHAFHRSSVRMLLPCRMQTPGCFVTKTFALIVFFFEHLFGLCHGLCLLVTALLSWAIVLKMGNMNTANKNAILSAISFKDLSIIKSILEFMAT